MPKAKKPPPGRSPAATSWSQFSDSALSSRDPGQWPSLLRQAWERTESGLQPLPYAPDNIESVGARASQYSS